ncbi:ABC transporter ATP-binding protein [uncultured Desulfobacter sp.]|uniref:ABC transporter ATP-binding protein n=1 Tax=uncultured Desulfobacter sp. TaxID=240139 RepID=UPI00374A4AC8
MANTMNQMNDDVLVRCEHVSKKFCRGLKRSLWYGVQDICAEINPLRDNNTALGKGNIPELRKDEFWAVNDVSFELKRGECLGLIGYNGAGKSTLLKMLNGLIKLDHGRITMKGRIGALIELNAGFNPILTGRENVYIYGAILGFTKEEIDSKYEAIVEFAEMVDFMGMPFRSYSSGMKVRLGFAVAAQMEPDVLIIDEVLAVGDVGFRSRCFNAINSIQKKAAIIFVSHAMPQIARMCTKLIVLNKGDVLFQGKDVPQGIEMYYSNFDSEKSNISGSGRAKIMNIRLFSQGRGEERDKRFVITYLQDMMIEMDLEIDPSIKVGNVNIAVFDKELRGVAQVYSLNSDFRLLNDREKMSIRVSIPELNLNPGIYTLSFIITDEQRGETLINHHAVKDFQVIGSFIGFTPVQIRGQWSRTDSTN